MSPSNELKIISQALKLAEDYELTPEFVWSAMKRYKESSNIKQAIESAKLDWDLAEEDS